MIAAVVCVDKNFGIGYKNNLLFHCKEDMRHFKEITTGGIVIVGRKTYESFPVAPLPDRFNIVVTRQPQTPLIRDNSLLMYADMSSVKRWLETNHFIKKSRTYIIGGESIYRELLPYCSKVYLTMVNNIYPQVDSYFPELDPLEWRLTVCGPIQTCDNMEYQFLEFDRIS